ncbi:hypothetical protein CBS101457_003911 [Exobasidium rhododendri]|nr:hypothetical protein CBS101457_003911 [Exobasidium rhododendri]
MQVEALPSSKLGTQEYWDSVYDREIDNFEQIGDEGEIWFGEEAVQRMVDFLDEARDEGLFGKTPSVLDLGTGNGHLLFELLDLSPPFTDADKMLGVDYSKPSIDLCNRIAKGRESEACKVRFEVVDFLADTTQLEKQRWDLICDKGTVSKNRGIALSSAKDGSNDPVSQYVTSLERICKTECIYLITSCNFTEVELIRVTTPSSIAGFSVHHVVPTPSFSFGGQKGSTTTTIAFRRKA